MEWLQWSRTEGTTNEVGSLGALNWEDQWVYKIGAQFGVLDVLEVRAGFNYGRAPVDANSLAAAFVPAISETHFTLGIGVGLAPNITLNAGAVIAPRRTSKGTSLFGAQEVSVSSYAIESGLSLAC